MAVVPFPTTGASDRLIDQALAVEALVGGVGAAVGDLAIICVSYEEDLWQAWPVAGVRGPTIVSLLGQHGAPIHWREVADLPEIIVAGGGQFDVEAEGFVALRWRLFRGLVAAREAFRPLLRARP